MLNVLLVILYQAMTLALLLAFWRYRQASPIFWFPLALALMGVGTLVLLDMSLPSDRVYAAMYFVALVSFAATALMYSSTAKLPQALSLFAQRPDTSGAPIEVRLSIVFFALSVLITIVYYYLVGYNVLLLLLTSEVEDYSSMRLAAYSGDTYFAPGYVNQFKNVLLPITGLSIGAWLAGKREKWPLILFAGFAIPFTVIAVAGTGQRAFLAYTFAAAVFGFVLHNAGRGRAVKRRYLVVAAIPLIAMFAFMTAAYRGSGGESSTDVLRQALDRFIFIQQDGGLIGFRYIYNFENAWFSEWMKGLVGIIPGQEGSTLAHELHGLIYGSERGTAPLTSVGSAYYNGQVFGVMLLFGSQGLAYAFLYHRFLKGRRSRTRSFAYGFLFFYLSAYVADAPILLLDNGLVTILVFLYLIRPRHRAVARSIPVPAKRTLPVQSAPAAQPG